MPALPIEGYDTSREDGVTRIRPVYAAPLPVEAVSSQEYAIPQEPPALPVELPVAQPSGILADADRALSGAVRAPFDALDERLFGKSGKKGTYREAIQKFFKTGPSDEVKTGVNRLLGTGGEERYKTWPEKLVVDAITAPGNVLKSETPVTTEELIKPALDVSNLAGTGGLASVGVHGRNPNMLGIVPVSEAKALNVKASTASELLQNIVKNTDGASIDADGSLIVNLTRHQLPEQALSESVRGGVFYLPTGSKYARHYNGTTGNNYGGSQKIQGETAFVNPLVVKGQTGGKMPENAYNQIMGNKKAYAAMESEAMKAVHSSIYKKQDPDMPRLLVEQFLEKHAPEMKDYADFILENSKKGNQLRYALTEAAIASAARKAGYDGIVGYSTKRDGSPFMSEVFDIRENLYPNQQGDYGVHDMFLKSDNQPSVGIGAVSKSEKPFYSALERSLGSINQNKASGEQWLGMLANKGGVKPDELQWSGVGDFLAGKPSVTKAEIDSFLKENAFGVQEVVKGGAPKKLDQLDKSERLQLINEFREREGLPSNEIPTRQELQQFLNDKSGNTNVKATRYHDYQLLGGENYREVLMTLPEKKFSRTDPRVMEEAKLAYNEKDILRLSEDQWRMLQARAARRNGDKLDELYKSSHWDEPNILAHMRMNDRTIDGKKSLHLEEIQSDWHQAGRKSGYKSDGDLNKWKELDASLSTEKEALAALARNTADQVLGMSYQKFLSTKPTPEAKEAALARLKQARQNDPSYIAQEKKVAELEAARNAVNPVSKVPDAPFKKNWHELALKRAIREAAENGYERLSWTPGEAQAARYDLSKQLKELQYLKHDDGKYELAGITVKGDGFNHPEKITADKLPDIVGKEIAEKIIKNEGKRARGHPSNSGYFEGMDLKIGGEGMKGFYDNIVPKTIEKLGKQFGVKVQVGKSGKDTIYYIDIPPAMRDKVLAEGFPLFSANVPVIDNDQTR